MITLKLYRQKKDNYFKNIELSIIKFNLLKFLDLKITWILIFLGIYMSEEQGKRIIMTLKDMSKYK